MECGSVFVVGWVGVDEVYDFVVDECGVYFEFGVLCGLVCL